MKYLKTENIFFIFLVIFCFIPPTTQASVGSIYIAQTAAGQIDGSSCYNATSTAFFNASGNWGSGGTQIGPGTTVHLCGTVSTQLTFKGSGTSGNPIVLRFEDNAKFSAQTWSGGLASAAIYSGSNRSYLEIDGGTNGLIEATNNGSSPTYSNQSDLVGVYFPGCSYCRVHHLTVSNLFVKNTTDSQGGGVGIDLSQSSNSRVDHNTVHDASICINWSASSANIANVEIDNNVSYRCNFGGRVGTVSNRTAVNVLWHDNEVYDWQNWDDLVANAFHHNGLHVFVETGTGSGSVTGLKIYNNYLHGDSGRTMTSNIFLEANTGPIVSPVIFNNVHAISTNSPGNGLIYLKNNVTSASLFNNLMGYTTNRGSNCMQILGTNMTSKNNIFQNCGQVYYIPSGSSGSIASSDYNNFYNNTYFGTGVQANSTITSWRSATGFDTHSATGNPNLDNAFKPQTGSSVLGAGIDLSSLNITPLNSDKAGVSRGSTWDIGAYQVSSGSVAPPPIIPPPTPPPTLSSISSSNITTTGATISWTTNTVSDTQVEYGLTTSYGANTQLNSTLTTSHSQSLSSLTSNTVYHYRVKSTDTTGGLTTSSDNTFTTQTVVTPPPVVPPPVVPPPTTTPVVPPPPSISPTSSGGGGGVSPLPVVPPTSPASSPTLLATQTIPRIILTQTLYVGSKGTQVTLLQNYLISLGYLAQGNNDGNYGPRTQRAVQQYQCKSMNICSGSLTTNGYGMVGTRTRLSLSGGGTTPLGSSAPNGASTLTAAQRAAIQAQINQLLVLVQQLILQLKKLKGL